MPSGLLRRTESRTARGSAVSTRLPRPTGALEQAVGAGYAHKEWIQNGHDLDPLRNHPRFQQLLAKLA